MSDKRSEIFDIAHAYQQVAKTLALARKEFSRERAAFQREIRRLRKAIRAMRDLAPRDPRILALYSKSCQDFYAVAAEALKPAKVKRKRGKR